MAYVEYESNNSGGSWWLNDDDWKALEKAGWVVAWRYLTPMYDEKGSYIRDERGIPKLIHVKDAPPPKWKLGFYDESGETGEYRWLGALATSAYKPDCSDIRAAADEWERITGKSATDAGCPCCGQPHSFTAYDDAGKYVNSGPSTHYEATW
jgi:hypothetical protein